MSRQLTIPLCGAVNPLCGALIPARGRRATCANGFIVVLLVTGASIPPPAVFPRKQPVCAFAQSFTITCQIISRSCALTTRAPLRLKLIAFQRPASPFSRPATTAIRATLKNSPPPNCLLHVEQLFAILDSASANPHFPAGGHGDNDVRELVDPSDGGDGDDGDCNTPGAGD